MSLETRAGKVAFKDLHIAPCWTEQEHSNLCVCLCALWPPTQWHSKHSNRPMSCHFFYICNVLFLCMVVNMVTMKNGAVSFWNTMICSNQ